MQKNILYHNPNCSKSRQTLDLMKEKGITAEIVEYLKTPPSAEEIADICTKLGIEPTSIIRTKEAQELGLNPADNKDAKEWFAILNKQPVLLERPILVYNGKAAVGRPPENILNII